MRYLLDTCVLSDAAKPRKHARLVDWLAGQQADDLAIGTPTVGELRYGIQRLPAGRKRETLKQWFENQLLPRFDGRVLDVDVAVAEAWGLLRASGEELGRPLPVVDGMLLATAKVHGLTFVTRDLSNLEHRGVAVLMPY